MTQILILHEPTDIAHGFVEAWNDKDADALAELFTEDADFVNVVALWWEDRRNIRRAHARGFRVMFGSSEMALTRTKLRLLGPDAAVVHAQWEMSGQVAPDGEPVDPRTGLFTFVTVRDGALGWRAVAAQNTDHIADAETIVIDDGAARPTSYVRGSR